MGSEIAARQEAPELTPFEVIERVISSGDLSRMEPSARVAFYWRTCESLGLNPLTRPFEFLSFQGKTILYARKDATDQLRRIYSVSITSLRRERDDELGLFIVYAHARTPDGREDESAGAVNLRGLAGEALSNAIMKAETKAKRRVTLSIVGLGFLDETETEGGTPLDVDHETGEIRAGAPAPTLAEQIARQAETFASATSSTVTTNRDAATIVVETPPIPPAAAELYVNAEEIAGGAPPIVREPMTVAESAAVPPEPEPDEPEDPELDERAADPEFVDGTPICGAENPYGPGPLCQLDPGHRGYHRADRTSWPAAPAGGEPK